MIAKSFPDLHWLKAQIAKNFRDRRGPGTLRLDTDGFPSVVINAKSRSQYRPDITGPLSVFMNLRGESRCKVDGRTVLVDDQHYFISNRFQPYTLEIQNSEAIETFNIHIGEYFSEQFFAGVMQSSDTLLNQGRQVEVPTVAFHNRLLKRDAAFNRLVYQLKATEQAPGFNKILFEERLAELLWHLLVQHRGALQAVAALPAMKPATKQELFRRLTFAADFMHEAASGQTDLETIAEVACLSKFHFLRLFRQFYGVSPYQYLQQLRIEKAERLLRSPGNSVADVAAELGFENSSSFSRLFKKHRGVYPSQFRPV